VAARAGITLSQDVVVRARSLPGLVSQHEQYLSALDARGAELLDRAVREWVSAFRGELREADARPRAERGTDPLSLYLFRERGTSLRAAEQVYAAAARSIVLPRALMETFMARVEPLRDAASLARELESLRVTAREILGDYAVFAEGRTGALPIQLLLPVESTDTPEDLLVLLTLLSGPDDGIYLLLREPSAEKVSAFQAAFEAAAKRLGVPSAAAGQIHVVAAGTDLRDLSKTAQRLGADPATGGVHGIAAREDEITAMPYLRGLHRMSHAETLREVVSAMLAAAYLREVPEDAPFDVRSLEQWMQEKGIDSSLFAERVARLAEEFAQKAYVGSMA
jgi:hypothetical protein